jgi:hypothetical protein
MTESKDTSGSLDRSEFEAMIEDIIREVFDEDNNDEEE